MKLLRDRLQPQEEEEGSAERGNGDGFPVNQLYPIRAQPLSTWQRASGIVRGVADYRRMRERRDRL